MIKQNKRISPLRAGAYIAGAALTAWLTGACATTEGRIPYEELAKQKQSEYEKEAENATIEYEKEVAKVNNHPESEGPIDYDNINWREDHLRMGIQPFIQQRILNLETEGESFATLSEFQDTENKGRGFRRFQFKNPAEETISLYDFERDGYVSDEKNPDKDGLIDAVVITDREMRAEHVPFTGVNSPVYQQGTMMFRDAYQAYLDRTQGRQRFSTDVLKRK